MTFDDRIVAMLGRLVTDRGTHISTRPDMVRGGLSDLLGPDARTLRAEIDAVALASEEDVATSLRDDGGEGVVERLTQRGLRPDVAEAATESWRIVLRHAAAPTLTDLGTLSDPPPSAPGAAGRAGGVLATWRSRLAERRFRRPRLLVPLACLVVLAVGAGLLMIFDDESGLELISVVGDDADTAASSLEELGFVVETRHDAEADEPFGTVVSTEPSPGTSVPEGSMIVLIIAGRDPDAPVEVPDVVEQTIADATESLEDAGLALGEVTERDDPDAAPGTVLSQSIEPGEEAEFGSTVDLVVSSIPRLTIPDVRNRTGPEALERLQAAGFLRVGTRLDPTSITPAGTVLGTEPATGKVIAADEKLTVVISGGTSAKDERAGGDDRPPPPPTTSTTTTPRPPPTPPTSTTTTTTRPPDPSFSVARGSIHSGGAGYWTRVSLRNYAPNSTVTLQCHDSVDPGGYASVSVAVDGAGNFTGDRCWSNDGPQHWISVNGVASNKVVWNQISLAAGPSCVGLEAGCPSGGRYYAITFSSFPPGASVPFICHASGQDPSDPFHATIGSNGSAYHAGNKSLDRCWNNDGVVRARHVSGGTTGNIRSNTVNF